MKKEIYDKVFITSSIIFNVLISILYLASKFGNMMLISVLGVIIVSLIIPFTLTLINYYKAKENKNIIVSNVIIIAYFIFEVLLDYILKIPFRDILWLHVVYIMVLWMALFSMIAVVRRKSRKMGFVLIATFTFLVMCLIYLII